MNQNSQDTQVFVNVLCVVTQKLGYPDELIDYLWRSASYSGKPDWGALYTFLKDQNIVFHRYLAIHDPFGWYLKVEVLGPTGFECSQTSDETWETRDETLNSVNDLEGYYIYGYID